MKEIQDFAYTSKSYDDYRYANDIQHWYALMNAYNVDVGFDLRHQIAKMSFRHVSFRLTAK